MTDRKAITIIFMLILVVVLLTGCSVNQPEPSESSDLSYAMVRMPDGSTIQGLCSESAFSYGTAMVVIDGVRYRTGAENVVVWKSGGKVNWYE